MMATLATERAVLPVKKHALANVGFHVTFRGLCKFAGAVAKRAIRIGNFYSAPAGTHLAFLNVSLSHPL
jgi:hypothetical protein